jgi:cbb3-type cytochrome oxidase subunit 3
MDIIEIIVLSIMTFFVFIGSTIGHDGDEHSLRRIFFALLLCFVFFVYGGTFSDYVQQKKKEQMKERLLDPANEMDI